MMIQEDVLKKVVNRITSLNIPYMIVGGIGVIFYGKPRMTHDVDVLVDIDPSSADRIKESFKDEFYISEDAIKEAINNRSMFNIVHHESGIKIDFWVLEDNDYDIQRFKRRQKHKVGGIVMFFSSPEDLILKKLLWYKKSEIEKHLDDAYGILRLQHERLDYEYLNKWAEELSVGDIFNDLIKNAVNE
ncbi:MAG: hypothetical protein AB1546_12650 [bacterium]